MKIKFGIPRGLYLFGVLFMSRIYTEFFVAWEGDPLLRYYAFALLGITVWVTMRNLRYLTGAMGWWFGLTVLSLVLLAFESYGGWGRWFVYLHVFSKLTDFLLVFGVYAYYQRWGLPDLKLLIGSIPPILFLNLVIFHPETFTMEGFLKQERGVSSASAFLLILPLLYYLNVYFKKGSMLYLIAFFSTLALIVFLQHRTVWVTTGIVLAIDLLLLMRTVSVRPTLKRVVPMLVLPVLAVSLGGLAIVLNNEAVQKKFEQNIADIRNPEKQGTGNFRLNQFEAYVPFLQEYPIAGMRLKGFELPIQFYHRNTGEAVWANGTGHHFHSFYVDRLFYFGLLGLLLAVAPPIYLVLKRLRQPAPMTLEAVTLVAYVCGGLVYGVSYNWPDYYLGLLGLALSAATVADTAPAPVPALSRPVTRQPKADHASIPSVLLHS
ncbi:O-antigen ligase family protein [Hymenobacter sp. BT730]|uniref:O-antigen ligase family protein n=1 Tax=Hymenobacter sp. BT730 TaxID=3063332 RepID=UPI0026E0E67E|nr:O-antigen ligase family protein [Hymenobacter sp. BT730]